ncbi:GNAT family N-acetyltransferase [Georhizobium profundi]|uniref:GNAT family N-acetyltransferase n=1 Tax=Georhizobium profundi TaxID=2341112 RepID=A0A3S9B664_9HYPH|nr:GNAT family N-acetyltransferase [Georhizobium profundi]AZN72455.1 GNAT family N-acetyltransferase [Georhizobium profundi]
MHSVVDFEAIADLKVDGRSRAHGMTMRPAEVDPEAWHSLADTALEANGFLSPGHFLSLTLNTRQARLSRMLVSRGPLGINGLLPLTHAWHVLRLPVPALVLAQPYLPLGTPLLGTSDPVRAAGNLIDAANETGAALIGLGAMTQDGLVAQAFTAALSERGLKPFIRNAHERAGLSAEGDAETYLRGGMGSKKLKELRRLRHRLEDMGPVEFRVARSSAAVQAAIARFLALEASGWKGRRGTAFANDANDAAYISGASRALASRSQIEICELLVNDAVIASGLVLRSGRSAFFFKTAYDETFERYSPGVQLTVDLTRHLFDDPAIDRADSVAIADHPMIDHVWRERIAVCDFFIPTRKGPAVNLCIAAFDARYRARALAKSLITTTRTRRKPN